MPRPKRSGSVSITPTAAIDDRELGSAALRVLLTLASYADKDGWCFPKQRTIADRLGVKQQAISKSIRDLARLGYVEIEDQFDANTNARVSSRYRVVRDFVLPESRMRTPQLHVVGSQPDVVGSPQQEIVTPTTPEVVTPTTPEVVAIEQPKGTTHRNTTPNGVGGKIADAPPPPDGGVLLSSMSDDARAFIDDWRRKQGRSRAPKINPTLAGRIEQAVADLGLERLFNANTWAAENTVPEIIKAIRAAQTRRKQGETPSRSARNGKPSLRHDQLPQVMNAPKPVISKKVF